jgi:arabinose-5-phosphate isomerase
VTAAQHVLGIFTDGDLRRALDRITDVRSARIVDVMMRNPRTIHPEALAVEVVEKMEQLKINQILVVDQAGKLVGALNTHDLLRAKVI